jgi:hypothetical protein
VARLSSLTLALILGLLPAIGPIQAQGSGPSTGDINLNNNNARNNNSSGSTPSAPPITWAEAEAMLGPSIPVINISNAASVFGSSDPLIAAAVSGWLSKIKEPHDRYGNIITKDYKSSYAPDKLPSSLIQHIVDSTKGQRYIALSAPQALSISVAQQQQRYDIIQQIIRNGRPGQNTNAPGGGTSGGGSAGPNGNGSGSGSGENVPGLNTNNSGGGSGNGGGGGSGGGSTPSQLESTYGVTISSLPKEWSRDELSWLDECLSKIPREWYAGHTFSRGSQAIDDQTKQPSREIVSDWITPTKTWTNICFYDPIFDPGQAGKPWPVPPYTGPESIKRNFQSCVYYELTNLLSVYQAKREEAYPLSKNPLVAKWAASFGWTYDEGAKKWTFDSSRKAERVDDWSIEKSPHRDLGRSVKYYMLYPQFLKKTATVPSARGRSRYEFIKNELKIREQPDAPHDNWIPPGLVNGGASRTLGEAGKSYDPVLE